MIRRQPREHAARLAVKKPAVFLNLPYDRAFRNLFLAYVGGISALGLIPRATLELPGGARRLDRISSLIQSCRYSIHDLSRVQLDRTPPATPRFNMPFELGLTVGQTGNRDAHHIWFVFETRRWRLQKSLSDLNGTDPYIHEGTPRGIFRELRNAFVRQQAQPTFAEMMSIYDGLRANVRRIIAETGAASVFEPSAFKELSVYASSLADELVNE